jgi:ribA/ribD-fused uncharacterized protein
MNSSIDIKKKGITSVETDAVVNAANEGLREGSGVCGVIFRAAGSRELQEACDKIGHCDTGDAVITPGFNLKAKYVIHAVGPIWSGGHHGEQKLLKSAYKRSLELAKENGCNSIVFPLISAGVFGYPVEKAWEDALTTCREYIDSHPDFHIDIVFTEIDEEKYRTGKKVLRRLEEDTPEHEERDEKISITFDKFSIGNWECPAVYFHKIDEPNGFLSNWYDSPFVTDDRKFTSVEQYIMYRKAEIFGDMKIAEQILATDDPETQKALGRKVRGYSEYVWNGLRQMVVFRALMAKFSQNKGLRKLLLLTGDAYLIECAMRDKIWACGRSLYDERRKDASLWNGTNILGFALMEVRKRLREDC